MGGGRGSGRIVVNGVDVSDAVREGGGSVPALDGIEVTGRAGNNVTMRSTSTISTSSIGSNGEVRADGSFSAGSVGDGTRVNTGGSITTGDVGRGARYNSGGSITAGNVAENANLDAGGSINCGTVARGASVDAGGSIRSGYVQAGANLDAGGSLSASGAEPGANLNAGGRINAPGWRQAREDSRGYSGGVSVGGVSIGGMNFGSVSTSSGGSMSSTEINGVKTRTDGGMITTNAGTTIQGASLIEIQKAGQTLRAVSDSGRRDMSMQDGVIRGGTVTMNGVEVGKGTVDLGANRATQMFR